MVNSVLSWTPLKDPWTPLPLLIPEETVWSTSQYAHNKVGKEIDHNLEQVPFITSRPGLSQAHSISVDADAQRGWRVKTQTDKNKVFNLSYRNKHHAVWIATPVKKGVRHFISRAVKHFRQGEIEEEKCGKKWTIYFPKTWQQANDFSSWNLRHWTQVRLPHSEKKPENLILSHVKTPACEQRGYYRTHFVRETLSRSSSRRNVM